MPRRDIFAIDTSVYDLIRGRDVNFNRSSSMFLEREMDGSVQLYPVDAYAPAIYSEDGAIYLEPTGQNFVLHNMNLDNSSWVKGSNVVVQPDEVKGPDGSYLADRIVWIPGNGNTQMLRFSMQLPAGRPYTMSALLKLSAGQCAPLDVIRVVGGVVGSPSTSLSFLNQSSGRYRFLDFGFTTQGRQPALPPNILHDGGYAVTALTATTVTVTIPGHTVAVGDFVGGRVQFSNLADDIYYDVLANTASSGTSVTITLNAQNLSLDGVTSTSLLNLEEPALQPVDLELYCERSAVIEWGGIQVEPYRFRTSMIYQRDQMFIRSATSLVWRDSPIAGLKTFGIFLHLKLWRGDGNVLRSGNFQVSISQGRLRVQASGAVLTAPDPLPAANAKIWIQVAEESASLRVTINGILVARSPLISYTADLNVSLDATTEGVRAIQTLVVTDTMLLDGEVPVGERVQQEVADLLNNPAVVSPTAIASHQPLIQLNPVTIPGKEPPLADHRITAINPNNRTITVESGQGYVNLQPTAVFRRLANGERMIVARPSIEEITTIQNSTSVNITLDSVAGILVNDSLVYGNTEFPGIASARFPFDPVDQQRITAINPGTRTLEVDSVLSFTEARAFIVSSGYEDKAEVIIESIDPINNTIVVNSTETISVGDTIVQPRNELLIDPENYSVGLLDNVPGVRVIQSYRNGVLMENHNLKPVTVRPYIRVAL